MTVRFRLPMLGLFALAGTLLTPGCGAAADSSNELGQGQTLTVASASGLVTTEVRAEANHYAQGRNVFLVQFDPPTTQLVDATAFMPVHGHPTPVPPDIAASGNGYRISNFIFSMPGLWNVTLGISAKNKMDKVEFALDVP